MAAVARAMARGCLAVACLGSCRGDSHHPTAPGAPVVTAASVSANPHNAISAVVRVSARAADSVVVRFSSSGMPGADGLTPAVRVIGDSAVVPVLGLHPARAYVLEPVAYGAGGTTTGAPLAFTTDTLPVDLSRYAASGSDPSPGYVVMAAGMYGLVIDNTGRVVWYRRFPDGPGLNFMAQPNGRYAARPPTADPRDPGAWVEIDALGTETRRMGCAHQLRPRLHDLIAQPDGGYWLLCDETRTMDLSSVGGVASARVTGTAVQHIARTGELLFSWSPFDHFAITDIAESERTGAIVNWTHGNALDLATDGNLLVSFRNLGEVTKIDSRTGDVIWRLGGRRNDFAFIDTPTPSFIGQHSARALDAGTLVLLDNLGDPAQSRVERYQLDERARTARLTRSLGSSPGVTTTIGGSVQPLAGGRTLVSFGTAGRVEEYDATGRVVWRIDGHAGYVFRAQRIHSLYAPGIDVGRSRATPSTTPSRITR